MDIHIARQPIFDRSSGVSGYELLFRDGPTNRCPDAGDARATSNVIIDSLTVPRLDTLSQGRDLYFNVTRDFLLNDSLTVLPHERTVLEILETVDIDDRLLTACRGLRELGYRIALDNFDFRPERMPLLSVADIIGVDILECDAEAHARLARKHGAPTNLLLAEKVETKEAFEQALELGYDLFQGYFFAQPTVVPGKVIPTSLAGYFALLKEVHRIDIDFNTFCDIVEREIGLTYKLLRHVNSAAFGFRGCVSSVRQAVLLLGHREVRRWSSLIAFAGIAEGESEELLVMALLRARFCELLAPLIRMNQRTDDLFLAGMFSVIDVILGCPMKVILQELPIPSDVSSAILDRSGPIGRALDLVISYSQGDWKRFSRLAAQMSLDESIVLPLYEAALQFCQSSMGAVSSRRAA
jgi:c-di-GMP-related signal transduction protein